MSVQLILYPQYHNGIPNSISNNPVEMLVDGISFVQILNAPLYEADATTYPQTATAAIENAPPTIPNTWYRFREIGGSDVPPVPTMVAGDLVLAGAGSGNLVNSGVYQKVTNLLEQTTAQSLYNWDFRVKSSTASPAGVLYQMVWRLTPSGAWTYQAATWVLNTSLFNTTLSTQLNNMNVDEVVVMFYWAGIDQIEIIDSAVYMPTDQDFTQAFDDFHVEDGQGIVDLYEDEDIPLTLSVDDFKSVAEKVQSYSKAFKLPATKRNNIIFNNLFDITRTGTSFNAVGDTFNPYKKTKCILKQDGFILFQGYLRLIDIIDKEGEISYNVNLYSEVIALADLLKERRFNELDFTELEHDYTMTNIENSWNDGTTGIAYTNPNSSTFRNDYSTVKYPFVDWDHQILVADGYTGTAATVGNPELTNLAQAFRPWINIKYLIDRIFNSPATPFTYSSAFFESPAFTNLYMDFNWGPDISMPSSLTSQTLAQAGTMYVEASWDELPPNGYNTSTTFTWGYPMPWVFGHEYTCDGSPCPGDDEGSIWTAQFDNQLFNIQYVYTFVGAAPVLNTEYFGRWIKTDTLGATTVITSETNNSANTYWESPGINSSENVTWSGSFSLYLNAGEKIEAEGEYDGAGPGLCTNAQVTIETTNALMVTSTLLGGLRGDLGQWDFLQGILTMFNIVSLPNPEDPNQILFEPYEDVFVNDSFSGDIADLTLATRGVAHDWTNKIDISQIKLETLTDINQTTVFQYAEDDDDYMFQNYKASFYGYLYGSLEYDATLFNILEGSTTIEVEAFASTVIKAYMPQYASLITPAIYALSEDGESEGFENLPRICYNNGIKDLYTTPTDYWVPAQSGVVGAAFTKYLQFSHLTAIPTDVSSPPVASDTQDYNFGPCQLITGDGSSPAVNNLFNLYWAAYFNELYNPDTKIMTLKVNLNSADINTFKFNDTVFIKNREFRVNKIDYKPNDLATVEFILIP